MPRRSVNTREKIVPTCPSSIGRINHVRRRPGRRGPAHDAPDRTTAMPDHRGSSIPVALREPCHRPRPPPGWADLRRIDGRGRAGAGAPGGGGAGRANRRPTGSSDAHFLGHPSGASGDLRGAAVALFAWSRAARFGWRSGRWRSSDDRTLPVPDTIRENPERTPHLRVRDQGRLCPILTGGTALHAGPMDTALPRNRTLRPPPATNHRHRTLPGPRIIPTTWSGAAIAGSWPAWRSAWPTTSTSIPPWSGSDSSPSPFPGWPGRTPVPGRMACLIPAEGAGHLGRRGAAGP